MLALTPTPPSKRILKGLTHFSDNVTPVPLNKDNVRFGSPLESFNYSKVPAKGHVAFTTTCDTNNRTKRVLSLPKREKTTEMKTSPNSSADTWQVSVKEQPIVSDKANEVDRQDMPSGTTNQAAQSAQPGDTKLDGNKGRRKDSGSDFSQSSSRGLAELRTEVLALTSNTPRENEKRSCHFADITTPAPSSPDSMIPGRLLQHFNSSI